MILRARLRTVHVHVHVAVQYMPRVQAAVSNAFLNPFARVTWLATGIVLAIDRDHIMHTQAAAPVLRTGAGLTL